MPTLLNMLPFYQLAAYVFSFLFNSELPGLFSTHSHTEMHSFHLLEKCLPEPSSLPWAGLMVRHLLQSRQTGTSLHHHAGDAFAFLLLIPISVPIPFLRYSPYFW